MRHYLNWKSPEYDSMEKCFLEISADKIEVRSHIDGSIEGKKFSADYHIILSVQWEVQKASLIFNMHHKERKILLQRHREGSWQFNGGPAPQFDGCIDIDIPLTPFTNSLPINRLGMPIGDKQKIKVLYIDLPAAKETALHQQYQRIAENEYNYQNIPNDFEADIIVDRNGFVIDYPGLFHRC